MGVNRGPGNESGSVDTTGKKAYSGDSWTDWQMGIVGLRPIVPGGYTTQNGGPGRSRGPCAINCDNRWNLYSFHTGGAQVVMGDGSVKFLSQNMSLTTLSNAFCINDGYSTGDF